MIYCGSEKTHVGELLERNSPELLREIIHRRTEEAARAARSGSLYYLRNFLDDGDISPNAVIGGGHDSILIGAAESGNIEKVKYVLGRGADIHGVTIDGRSPLIGAAFHGHDNVISLLIAGGIEIDRHDQKGKTALMYAATKGRFGAVQALLAAGANPMRRSHFGHTALQYAKRGEKRFNEYLDRKSARLEARGGYHWEFEELDGEYFDRDYHGTKRRIRRAMRRFQGPTGKGRVKWEMIRDCF